MFPVYRDRSQAGEEVAGRLGEYAGRSDVTVLALPRGGMPVAFPVARALRAPLDILAVRKLGVPGHEELAMGAVASGGVRILNAAVVTGLGIDDATIDVVTAAERRRLMDSETRLRAGRPPAPMRGRVVVLVDDGLATGATMEAAIESCRRAGVAGVVVAVPVGPQSTVTRLRSVVDDVVCPAIPPIFRAVGQAYSDFEPVTDDEVIALLAAAGDQRA